MIWVCSFKLTSSQSDKKDNSAVEETVCVDSLTRMLPEIIEHQETQPKNIVWRDSKCGFRYLDGMTYKPNVYENEVAACFDIYKNSYSELSYTYLGAWAVIYFPSVGDYVAPGIKISKITYQSNKQQIYSGYVSDGRIFYLKTHVDVGVDVDHLQVLTLLYNSRDQSKNEILIKEVQRFNPN